MSDDSQVARLKTDLIEHGMSEREAHYRARAFFRRVEDEELCDTLA